MHRNIFYTAIARAQVVALLLSLTALQALATCDLGDTIYVNNTRTKAGGEQGGCDPDSAFRTITGALAYISGGANRVVAVMGTGIPYREDIIIAAGDSGSTSAPLALFARGSVTIDGGDVPPDDPQDPEGNRWTARYASPTSTLKLWAAYDSSRSNTCDQVVLWSNALGRFRRYPRDTATVLINVTMGKMLADTLVDSVYVNPEDHNQDYSQYNGYIATRRCLRIRASNVTVDGFTILHSRTDGIEVSADSLRYVTIKNCIVKESADNGIDLTQALLCTLSSNTCAFNSDHGIVLKTGTVADPVADCNIVDNACYENDDDTQERGGINGIRIGSAGTPTTGHHVIQRNRAYRNEDSGIEVNGSYVDTLRYNQSWENRDHGYDHLKAREVTHVGDLAYGNNRSGMSIEQDALRIRLHNCVMADNGREAGRHDYELEVVRAARDSFVGDYNVLYRPNRSETIGCVHGEEADTILVSWRHKDLQSSPACSLRCADPDSCFGTVARFAAAGINPNHNEAHSKGAEVKFVNAGSGDFRARTSSAAVDGADTTVTGWRTTDVLGYKRFDCRVVPNVGNPAAAYADIGPYEHDDGGPTIVVENPGCTSLRVKWTARGASGDTLPTPAKYEVFMDDSLVREDTSPQDPGNVETETFSGLEQGHVYEFFVRTTDADGEIAESNKAYNTPCCSAPCEVERPGGGSRAVVANEEVDYPLALGHAGPNPSPVLGRVSWSIPRAQVGASYDLALFDIAGRKVSTVAKGVAKAGRFSQELPLRSANGMVLHSGIFFLRLRVGGDILMRTLVLTR